MKIFKAICSSVLALSILATAGMSIGSNASLNNNYMSQGSYEIMSALEPYIDAAEEINQELGSNFGLLNENYQMAYNKVRSMPIEDFKNNLRESFEENRQIIQNHAVSIPSPIYHNANITKTVIDHGNGNVEEIFTNTDSFESSRLIREDVMRQEHVVASSYFRVYGTVFSGSGQPGSYIWERISTASHAYNTYEKHISLMSPVNFYYTPNDRVAFVTASGTLVESNGFSDLTMYTWSVPVIAG